MSEAPGPRWMLAPDGLRIQLVDITGKVLVLRKTRYGTQAIRKQAAKTANQNGDTE